MTAIWILSDFLWSERDECGEFNKEDDVARQREMHQRILRMFVCWYHDTNLCCTMPLTNPLVFYTITLLV